MLQEIEVRLQQTARAHKLLLSEAELHWPQLALDQPLQPPLLTLQNSATLIDSIAALEIMPVRVS